VTKHEAWLPITSGDQSSRQNPRDKATSSSATCSSSAFTNGSCARRQFRLPTLGRAEDAADSFATIALLDAGSEFSINVLVQAARGLFLSDRRDRKQGEETRLLRRARPRQAARLPDHLF